MKWSLKLLVMLSLTAAAVRADTLTLRNGKTVEGKVLQMNAEGVRFESGNEIRFYKDSEIASIKKESPAEAAAPAVASTTAPGSPSVAVGSMTIPAGTVISMKLDEDVTSRQSSGTKFTGVLETNILVNNQVAVPAGTKVYGKISGSRQQRLVGQSAIAIELTGFNIGGNVVPIKTEVLAGSGDRKVRQGARGAAAGAAIGAAAGGGEAPRRAL